jgi:hypothetical protein
VAFQPRARQARVPEEVLEAFRAVAPTVEAFARERGLLLDRYRRGRSAWELRFEREAGGEAALVLSYREQTGHVLDLSAVWWIDDRKARRRRLRSEKVAVWDRRAAPALLREALEEGLRRIDAWREADLGPPRGPYLRWSADDEAAPPGQRLPRR